MGEVIDYNITFALYAQKWLERIKKDYSPAYHQTGIVGINWANKYIGGCKMRDISPVIVQNFFDQLDEARREIVAIYARPTLRKIMEEKNIRYKNFRYEHGLNSASLANALSGKNVSLAYAKSMADILGVEVSEIFNVKKEERYYAAPTIDKVKRAVRCVLAMTKRQRIVEHNFASADYISYGRKVQRNIECLDDKGAQQLFQAILNYDNIKAKTAILLLLMTGMRRGKLCGLEWQDIDLKKKIFPL